MCVYIYIYTDIYRDVTRARGRRRQPPPLMNFAATRLFFLLRGVVWLRYFASLLMTSARSLLYADDFTSSNQIFGKATPKHTTNCHRHLKYR